MVNFPPFPLREIPFLWFYLCFPVHKSSHLEYILFRKEAKLLDRVVPPASSAQFTNKHATYAWINHFYGNITKSYLFKYIEIFADKNLKFSDKTSDIFFSYFC